MIERRLQHESRASSTTTASPTRRGSAGAKRYNPTECQALSTLRADGILREATGRPQVPLDGNSQSRYPTLGSRELKAEARTHVRTGIQGAGRDAGTARRGRHATDQRTVCGTTARSVPVCAIRSADLRQRALSRLSQGDSSSPAPGLTRQAYCGVFRTLGRPGEVAQV